MCVLSPFGRSRDNSVGIVNRLRAGRSGVRKPASARNSSPKRPDRLTAPSNLFSRYRHFFSRVELPEREAYNSSPSVTKVKNEWSCTSTPLLCHDSVDRDNFGFFFFPHSDVFIFPLFCCQNDWLAKSRNFITNR
jgi:hypothetical protein